jgi:hypothetical protein
MKNYKNIAFLFILVSALFYMDHPQAFDVSTWVDENGTTRRTSLPNTNKSTQYNIMWGSMTRPLSRDVILDELLYSKTTESKDQTVSVNSFSPPKMSEVKDPLTVVDPLNRNPFYITQSDFWTDLSLVPNGEAVGPVPAISERDASWFTEQIQKGLAPDLFAIGGHHVIAEGFHNHAETRFLYLPSLFETLKKYPDARTYFDQVKIAILWGCNSLSNLEPHAADGSFLAPTEIKNLYETNKTLAIGTKDNVGSLEGYKSRLATVYGPNAEHYEYTRIAKNEKCEGPGKYENCHITNLERIMPDRGLFDGSHRFNGAWWNKRVFRNAHLVLGFNNTSPNEEQRVEILKAAIDRAYKSLNKNLTENDPRFIHNVLREIIDDATENSRRERVIEALRAGWTSATWDMNTREGKRRLGGSITPLHPHLDANGVYNVKLGVETPSYQPYEQR